MTTIFIRQRKPALRADDGVFCRDSWFRRFGEDTAIVSNYHGKYSVTTYRQLGERKKQRQREAVARKRASDTEIRPLYVWVFHCPGPFFMGWWTYLIGRGISEGKSIRRSPLIQQIMELFPCNELGLFNGQSSYYELHHDWMPLFAKRYCVRNASGQPRKHVGRIQGKAAVWAEVRRGQVTRIIRKAEWPRGWLSGGRS